MLKQPKNGVSGSNNWSRICDTCRSAPCTIYCHADLAYLCSACDARIHAANRLASRHDRVWLCEACERAPAAFLCKADAASLCHSCDADIHSANPLAARHHRVPISPPPPPPSSDDSPFLPDDAEDDDDDAEDDVVDEEDEHEAASWLLVNPIKTTTNNTNTAAAASATTTTTNNNNNHHSSSFLFGGEVDEYLDLMDSNSCGDNHYSNINHHYDSVVPVQQQPHHFHLALDLDSSKSPAYPYNANPSLSQNVSFSSVDVGIVPESTEMSGGGGGDVSGGQYSRPPKGTIDLFTGPPLPLEIPSQLSPMDREARVLRYREKKKTRKFQKTIRYASRKAYAETRPRIKGRFAKRTEVEAEVDQMFSTTLMTENGGYGIVPSF